MKRINIKPFLDWTAYLTLLVVLIVGLAKMFDLWFEPRCKNIGGEWHTLRGCRVTNLKGETQWISHP